MAEMIRLSPQQRHLWSLGHLCSLGQWDGYEKYRTTCVVRIDGVLQTDLLVSSIRRVVERHEILRTRLRMLPGMSMPVQVIDDSSSFIHRMIEESSTSLELAETSALFEEMSLPFEDQPPLRTTLVRLSDRLHLLLIL